MRPRGQRRPRRLLRRNGARGRLAPRVVGDMDILAAIDDRNLLGASIRDPDSWKPWRALLAAAFGYRACTGRTAPLRGLVEGQNSDTLSLASGVDIVVRPASFRSARGVTTIACICDETAFWHSESSANPDTEILRALRPSLTKGPLIAISSPYSRKGELWKAYAKHYGKDSRVLLRRGWVMHQTPRQLLVRARCRHGR
jgi:hypothetical protein